MPIKKDDLVYVFGARSSHMSTSIEALKYSLTENCWKSIKSLPSDFSHTCCVTVGDSILLTSPGENGVYEYNGSE